MKKEYLDKIELAKKCLKWDDTIPSEIAGKNGDIAYNTIEELCRTKDNEVLVKLLDFFNKENDEWGGFTERLQNEISDNFSLEQILQAFYKKYNSLANNDLDVCAYISMWFIWGEEFDPFRRMFNAVKPELAEKILDKMDKRNKNRTNCIEILRQDMKTWEVKKE